MSYKEILAERKAKFLKPDSRLSLKGFLKDYKLKNSELTSKNMLYMDLDLEDIKRNNKIPDEAYFNKRR